MQKWVVALTDGDDTRSAKDACSKACASLCRSDVNLAVITVGMLLDKDLV